jgi:hypothetical protein
MPGGGMSDLDQRLLAAHAAADRAALVTLYCEAADASQCENARGFFLTQAFVFALDAGDARAEDVHRRLSVMGRA